MGSQKKGRSLTALCLLVVLLLVSSPSATAFQSNSKMVFLIAIEVAPEIKVVPGGKVPGSERLSKRLQKQLTVTERFNVPGNFWTVRAEPGLSVAQARTVCRRLIGSNKVRNCEQFGTFG